MIKQFKQDNRGYHGIAANAPINSIKSEIIIVAPDQETLGKVLKLLHVQRLEDKDEIVTVSEYKPITQNHEPTPSG